MLKQLSIAVLAATVATAASANGFTFKVGAGYLDPTADSDIAGGAVTKAEVSGEAAILPSIDYRFGSSPFSAELLLATPFEHTVTGDFKGVNQKIAEFKQLPPTLTFKYNTPELLPGLTANVGVGATVLVPYEEQLSPAVAADLSATKLEAKTTVAPAAQIGVNYSLPSQPWGIFADVRYADLKADLEADGTKIGELEVNPVVYSIGVSHKF